MGDDPRQATIEFFQTEISALEEQVRRKKLLVNHLCDELKAPRVYEGSTDDESGRGVKGVSVQPDEFFAKPLATAVRLILEKRRAAGQGPASAEDIYPIMIQGGFQFEAKNDANAKRALAISLAKNTSTFVRLPNGYFALTDWYPELPRPKNPNGGEREEAKKGKANRPAAEPEDDHARFEKNFDAEADELTKAAAQTALPEG